MTTITQHIPQFASAAILLAALVPAAASAEGNFYLKPHVGLGLSGDDDFDQRGVAADGASGSGEYDTGFAAGLGFGYRYGNGFSAELDWEYRSNDVDRVDFSDGSRFDDGDLASNIFYLNGYYTFDDAYGGLRPYVGAGLGWVQEIDLDLDDGGGETSYSSDGDIAWQLMVGAETEVADNWRLQGEIRYSRVDGVDLDEEGGNGRITDLDYETWTFGIGVAYDF